MEWLNFYMKEGQIYKIRKFNLQRSYEITYELIFYGL
jgi:hypothetical protein